MWTCTWMSFTSHTFTSLFTHQTRTFWRNVFDLASYWFMNLSFMEIFTRHDSRIWTSVDSRISQILDSRVSQVRDFRASQVWDSRVSQVRDFRASQVQDSRVSQVRDFRASQIQDSRSSQVGDFPENSFHDFRQTRRFEGDRFFLNSPTVPSAIQRTSTALFRKIREKIAPDSSSKE
jgi:hypothetical protein